MRQLIYFFITCIIFLVTFSNCKNKNEVLGIKVEPKNLELNKGDVAQLYYLIVSYRADDKSVTWKSKNPAIAKVSETGLVNAISDGETKIIVTTNDGNFSDSVFVKVFRGSPAGDSIALLKLYEIAIDLPYWDLSMPMNYWNGVELNEKRRVVYVNNPNEWSNAIAISKPLDKTISNLDLLKSLIIRGNGLNGNLFQIPSEVMLLTELQDLILCDGFTGEIPQEIGNLTKLTRLGIYRSQLSGNIPKEIKKLKNLKRLRFSENNLSGNIPMEIFELADLEELRLEENNFTGNIPVEIAKLSKLMILYLNNNQLTGEIPKELGNIPYLYELYLNRNYLSGNIPQSLLNNFWWGAFCPQNGTNFTNLDCNYY